jgi:hypothetical protein
VVFYSGGETVTIKRRAEASTDSYGNKTYTTSNIVIKNVLVGFGSTDEPIDVERDAIDAKITLYFPRGTVIEDSDKFTIRNSEWVKDGQAQTYNPPFQFSAGVVVYVRQRRG